MAKRRPLFNLKPVVTPEIIEEALDNYFDDLGGSTGEPLLAAHLMDPTPHPVYDNLAAGRFVAHLQNGMA